VLRPPHFREHETSFVLTWDAGTAQRSSSSNLVKYICLRVPPHLRGQHWHDLLGKHRPALTDQLVLHASHVKDILSKVERPEFIHVYVSSVNSSHGAACQQGDPPDMLFELPRFGLEFELRAGSIWSKDYSGYCLHPCQQLLEHLPDFRQYLVLRQQQQGGGTVAQKGGQRVLVPVGLVQRKREEVAVVHGSSCRDELKVRVKVCLQAVLALISLVQGIGGILCRLYCFRRHQQTSQPCSSLLGSQQSTAWALHGHGRGTDESNGVSCPNWWMIK
jgi:hypothetical protein